MRTCGHPGGTGAIAQLAASKYTKYVYNAKYEMFQQAKQNFKTQSPTRSSPAQCTISSSNIIQYYYSQEIASSVANSIIGGGGGGQYSYIRVHSP